MATTKKANGEVLTADEINLQAGHIITVEAGENVTAGKVGYVHLTDGKAYTSDTGTADDIRANGIFLTTATSGNDVDIQTGGVYTTTGLTDKEDYYLGSAGAISTTLSGVRIGTALSTTQLYIEIVQDDRDAVSTVKGLHIDETGVPSNLITAFWQKMDGTTISDSESPIDGVTVDDLNSDGRFLKGGDTSGAIAGSASTGASTQDATAGSGGGTFARDIHLHTINPLHLVVVWLIKKK